MSSHYKDAGVNIDLGDRASKILYEAARSTWANRGGRLGEILTPFDDFTGVRGINAGSLPAGTLLGMGFDGIGTKVEIGERLEKHDTLAFDLFAMVCDDAVVRGAEPVLIGTVLDINALSQEGDAGLEGIRQLARGYVAAAREARVAVINGELAELGARVQGFGPFNYNWCAGVIWFARQERMLTGFETEPGDALVGLREKGFRSNGLSLVRRILSRAFGDNWHTRPFGDSTLGELVISPSQIYTRAIVDMVGGFDGEPQAAVHGVAHITGGGIPGKLGRALKPKKLGAMIDAPFIPEEIILYCQELGHVPDEEAYRTWNMGQGMIIITPDPEPVIKVAESCQIESKVIGKVTESPEISILSQGLRKNEMLTFG
jgi:phosphoribosylformylglycinamidine cyclo-ligase